MKLILKSFVLGLSVVLISACGGGGGGSDSTVNTNTNNAGTTLQSILVSPDSQTIAVGATMQMVATGSYSNGGSDNISTSVSWSVSDSAVASISATGLLTAQGVGSVSVSAIDGSITDSVVVNVTVSGNAITILSVAIMPNSVAMPVDSLRQVSAIATNSDNSTTNVNNIAQWSSADSNIFTVSQTGVLTAHNVGQANLKVSINGVSDTVAVTVNSAEDAELQISEIGSGSTQNGYWFELYNPFNSAVELGEYQVRSQKNENGNVVEVVYNLPAKSVPAGEYLIIMTEDLFASSPLASFAGNPNVVILPGAEYHWTSSGFLELIKDNETTDFVRFGNNSKTPTTSTAWTGGAGPFFTQVNYVQSLARDALNTDTDDASDWGLRAFSSMGGPNDIDCANDDDEDGIPDCSEVAGSTYAGMDLYAWGARVNQKDLFVEIDYMNPAARPGEDVQGMVPQREALDKIVAEFLSNGIHVHFDAGDIFDQNSGIDPLDYDLGGGQAVTFAENVVFKVFPRSDGADTDPNVADVYDYKAQFLAVERRSMFYYILLSYSQAYYTAGVNGSSGVSEVRGNDVLVSIGHWGLNRSNAVKTNELINFQSGTIMHEFGHALGLNHGGGSNDSENFKPNYLSVMNYMYQLNGLPVIGFDEGDRYDITYNRNNVNCDVGLSNSPFSSYLNFKIGYSDGSSLDLDELTGITESQGLRRPGSGGVDFNCDGDTDDVLIGFDTNENGVNPISDHDDWGNIAYFFADPIRRIANGNNADTPVSSLFVGRNWQAPEAFVKEPAIPDFSGIRQRAYERAYLRLYDQLPVEQ